MTTLHSQIFVELHNSPKDAVIMAQKNNLRVGEQVWSKMPKVNAELLTLTYGSLIMQVRNTKTFLCRHC